MSNVQYKIDYDEDGARQVGKEIVVAAPPRVRGDKPKRRPRRLPSSVQTALTIAVCGTIFFGAVAFAPEGWRPQDFTGRYVGDVAGEVKANEADIQGQLEAYTAQLRTASEQQSARMRAVAEGIIRAYTALYDLNRVQIESANQMRGALVNQQMSQTRATNGVNIGYASIAEMLGQGMELLEPGSGADALRFAETQRGIASDRMQETAVTGAQVNVSPYVAQLPDPAVIAEALNSVPAMEIPPPPRFDRRGN